MPARGLLFETTIFGAVAWPLPFFLVKIVMSNLFALSFIINIIKRDRLGVRINITICSKSYEKTVFLSSKKLRLQPLQAKQSQKLTLLACKDSVL